MSQLHLPVTHRVRQSYWVESFGIVMAFTLVFFFFSFLFKGPHLINSFFDWTILFFLLTLIFLFFGLILRLEMTKDGFRYCGLLGIYKIPWREIQRVEYKIDKYRRRGPNVEIWVYGTDQVRPIKMTLFMFERGAQSHFFDSLKAYASQAIIEPQVIDYFHQD